MIINKKPRLVPDDCVVRSGFVDGNPLEISGNIPKAIVEMAITLKRDGIANEDTFDQYSVRFPRINNLLVPDDNGRIIVEFYKVKKDGTVPYYLKRALSRLGLDGVPEPEIYARIA